MVVLVGAGQKVDGLRKHVLSLRLETSYLFFCHHPVSYTIASERALYGRLYEHDGVEFCI